MKPLHRRTLLQSAGVALALPVLEAMACNGSRRSHDATPKRAVFICTSLGLHAPSFFPEKVGSEYQASPYLEFLQNHRRQFTIFSGLSHPDQAGADGHSSQMTWLTAARFPGLGGFRNSISVDQFAREKIGPVTRFPSIQLSTDGSSSQSYSNGGVMVPAEWRPSVLFEQLFLQGKPEDMERQRQLLREGGSVLDGLGQQTKRIARNLGKADKERLESYLDSVRKAEVELQQSSTWLDKPKPIVDRKPPTDIEKENDLVGRLRLLVELIPLILQTDSTRILSLVIHGRNDIPLVDGVTIDHHNLSHHGQDEAKIAQLQRIETEIMKCFGNLLAGLQEVRETSGPLLEQTVVLFGSNLGNANAHDWRNLPIILAGGKFAHGQHVAFDREHNKPLCSLFVNMLQHLNLEVDQFASSSGSLSW